MQDNMAAAIDILDTGGLSKSQQRVVDTLRRHPSLIPFADTAEVARHAEVNNSTVVRTAQSLGYRGWPDLQRELRARYLTMISSEQTLIEHGSSQSPLHRAIEHDLSNLRQTSDLNSQEDADATIATLAAARRIFVLGMGSFAGPASMFAHLGRIIGYDITHEGRGGVHLASTLAALSDEDVLVNIALWRTQRQLQAASESAKRSGAAVVAITDIRNGPTASVADRTLIVPSEGISFFQSITATTSIVYGLLAGMEAAHPERSRDALRRTQKLWNDLDIYSD